MSEDHNERFLEAIRQNDERTLKNFYDQNRSSFLAWSQRYYNMDDSTSLEIYQNAYLKMYMNIRVGKLVKLSSKPVTYLYSIAKNMMRQHLRNTGKGNSYTPIEQMTEEELTFQSNQAPSFKERQEEQAENKALVKALLQKIGDPCRELLTRIFVHGEPASEIVESMNYSNEAVVRKRKSICLKRLREIAVDHLDADNDQ